MNSSRTRSDPPMLRMEVGCDFSQVRPAADRVQRFLKEQGCQEAARIDCELVMVEGCNNAIKYTRTTGADQPVIVEVRVDAHEIELRIIDHGPGFTWPDTCRLPEPEMESGRGLYLIRTLTDYSTYLRASTENTLVLRKRRTAA